MPINIRRVLYVEDDPMSFMLVRNLLQNFHGEFEFDVQQADSIDQAVQCLDRQRFDIVLLKLYFPVSHGFELLKHRKRFSHLLKTPFIILTDIDGQPYRTLANVLLADGFFVTPLDLNSDEFLQTLVKLC